MARWRAAEQFMNPYLNILLVTPMSALIPIMDHGNRTRDCYPSLDRLLVRGGRPRR